MIQKQSTSRVQLKIRARVESEKLSLNSEEANVVVHHLHQCFRGIEAEKCIQDVKWEVDLGMKNKSQMDRLLRNDK